MELKVLNKQGKATAKKVKLNAEVFGIEPNDHAIYLDVKQYLANQRQGTHQSRERGEIIGSTRKIKNKRGLVRLEQGLLKIHCSEVEVVFLDLDQETTVSS